MTGSTLLATVVEIQNTNVDIPVEVNGTVQTFSGPVTAFQFEIEGRLIKGDAATLGIGIITPERYKQIYDFLVAGGLLDPKTDWKKGFDDRFVKDLKIGVK